jgi:hypothetical protein
MQKKTCWSSTVCTRCVMKPHLFLFGLALFPNYYYYYYYYYHDRCCFYCCYDCYSRCIARQTCWSSLLTLLSPSPAGSSSFPASPSQVRGAQPTARQGGEGHSL